MYLNQIISLLQDDGIEAVKVFLTTKEEITVKKISDESTADVLIVKEPESALIPLKHVSLVKGVKKRKTDISNVFN